MILKKAEEINEKSTWQELTTGAEIYEPATNLQVNTGEWREIGRASCRERV